MTPGDIVLGILAVSGIVGLVTVTIAMTRTKVHVVGIVRLKAEKETDERPPAVDQP